MGQFKIEIIATGGHGCNRDVKHGEKNYGCRSMNCPDCRAREFVKQMQQYDSVESATLRHWPGTEGEVTDDLLTGIRTGNF